MGHADGDISNYCQTGNVIATPTIIDGLTTTIIAINDIILGKSREPVSSSFSPFLPSTKDNERVHEIFEQRCTRNNSMVLRKRARETLKAVGETLEPEPDGDDDRRFHRYASECRQPSKVHREVWLARFDVQPSLGAAESRVRRSRSKARDAFDGTRSRANPIYRIRRKLVEPNGGTVKVRLDRTVA